MAAGGERFELAHRARLDRQREFSFHCTYYFSKARVGQVEGLGVCKRKVGRLEAAVFSVRCSVIQCSVGGRVKNDECRMQNEE